jgi:histone deacetylase complex regulatory component SIN3
MTSALRYVQSVKTRCADKPDMIREFHTIMRSLNDKVYVAKTLFFSFIYFGAKFSNV